MKKINETYAYGVDTYNVILYKSRTVQDVEDENVVDTKWIVKGYFSTFNALLKRLLSITAKDDLEDLIKVRDRIEEIYKWMDENLPKITPKDLTE